MLKKIKWFIQRGKRGYADCDIWDFSDYLTDIIIAGLKILKENQHGCPSQFWDKEAVNNECHKWQEILEKMIQGFEAYKQVNDWRFIVGKFEQKIDKKRLELLEEKYNRGMKLFARFFAHLWD